MFEEDFIIERNGGRICNKNSIKCKRKRKRIKKRTETKFKKPSCLNAQSEINPYDIDRNVNEIPSYWNNIDKCEKTDCLSSIIGDDSSSKDRRLILNNYIKENIDDSTNGKCGCHFDYISTDTNGNLLNELNEFYDKNLKPSGNRNEFYCLNAESSFGSSTNSTIDKELLLFGLNNKNEDVSSDLNNDLLCGDCKLQHQQQQERQKQGQSLFIDRTNKFTNKTRNTRQTSSPLSDESYKIKQALNDQSYLRSNSTSHKQNTTQQVHLSNLSAPPSASTKQRVALCLACIEAQSSYRKLTKRIDTFKGANYPTDHCTSPNLLSFIAPTNKNFALHISEENNEESNREVGQISESDDDNYGCEDDYQFEFDNCALSSVLDSLPTEQQISDESIEASSAEHSLERSQASSFVAGCNSGQSSLKSLDCSLTDDDDDFNSSLPSEAVMNASYRPEAKLTNILKTEHILDTDSANISDTYYISLESTEPELEAKSGGNKDLPSYIQSNSDKLQPNFDKDSQEVEAKRNESFCNADKIHLEHSEICLSSNNNSKHSLKFCEAAKGLGISESLPSYLRLSKRKSSLCSNSNHKRENCYCAPSITVNHQAQTRVTLEGLIKENKRLLSNSTVNEDTSKILGDNSMKVARDIAKVTIPSLSTLQYLPSKTRILEKPQHYHEEKQQESNQRFNNSLRNMSPLKRGFNTSRKTQSNPTITLRMNPAESREDIQHDESCLLNRICLCNCMSRAQPADSAELKQKKDKMNHGQSSRGKSNSSRLNFKGLNEKKQRKSKKAADNSAKSSSDNIAQSPTIYLNGNGDELNEPSVELNVKSSSSTFNSKGSLFSLSSNGGENSPSCQKEQHSKGSKSRKLPSRGLEENNSPGSESYDDSNSVKSAPDSFDESQSNSSKVSRPNEDKAKSNNSQTKKQTKQNSANDSSTRQPTDNSIQSNYYQPSTESKAPKKSRNYKKFLSPTKLFATQTSYPSPNPSGDLDSLADSETIAEHTNDTKSFLSRSLSRLSGRASSQQRFKRPSSSCISPTPSSSSALQDSLVDSSTSGSLNQDSSLDAKTSYKSLLHQTPGIVIDKVAYCKTNQSVDSLDMTRSINESYSYRRQNSSFDQDKECLDWASASESSSLRACSLPASPPTSRRRRFGTVQEPQRARSPRLTHSPVPLRSPSSLSTKIEDGLKVCSIEHFEKHIGNIKGNQIEVQKRLFEAWINHYCPNLIRNDLIEELRDGIKLIGLIANLTRDKQLMLQYEKLKQDKQSYINRLMVTPSSRLKNLSNVSIAVSYLKDKLGMRLINLNPMDVVSGKPNVVLGLCWNLILHFQLEQNFLKLLQDDVSEDTNERNTSHLLKDSTNEDRANFFKHKARSNDNLDSFTQIDIISARNRILDHINQRFNLKLTKLASNFLDSDVILTILKNLLPDLNRGKMLINSDEKEWDSMNENEKLDHCFDLAKNYLNVPKLFNAQDLKQQVLVDNNSKSILVYLSMLLNSPKRNGNENFIQTNSLNSDEQIQENGGQDDQAQTQTSLDIETRFKNDLDEIERADRFDIDKIQMTLTKIRGLESNYGEFFSQLDKSSISRYEQLKDEAHQVETLINWINQADKLFESTQKSSTDLSRDIKAFEKFFAPENIPKFTVPICKTLERQYRECLSTSKQRFHSMEQTLKNWTTYEEARARLRDWLVTAESKLVNALKPSHNESDARFLSAIEKHSYYLKDLIDYFELKTVDDISNIPLPRDNLSASLGSINDIASISGSVLSLGSNSSRNSVLVCSKKASHQLLFDDFELKCRLLAAMLNSAQRDVLLLGVSELKYRLRYITEQRVPQVLNELISSINRCELSIKEQEEPVEIILEDEDGSSDTSSIDENHIEEVYSPAEDQLRHDTDTPKKSKVSVVQDVEKEAKFVSSVATAHNICPKREVGSRVVKTMNKSNKKSNVTAKINGKEKTVTGGQKSWSLFDWFTSSKVEAKQVQVKQSSKSSKKNCKKNCNKVKSKATSYIVKSKNFCPHEDSHPADSYILAIWRKIVRASKASLSLNIILLMCLAGVCVVPLINRDACCELSQSPISTESLSLEVTKPT